MTACPLLVDTAWLEEHLGAPGVRVLDASWYLRAEKRDRFAEFEAAHIPGARYFDIDRIADTSDPLPHMFPDAATFARMVGELGVGNADHVIAYDGGKLTASARCWWMFRAFGHDRVSLLDGGFGKWRAEGRPVEAGQPSPAPVPYEATSRPALVARLDDMRRIVAEGGSQILDARSVGRFHAREPEPRAGMRAGHMPGAFNLPYPTLLAPDGTLRQPAELERLFRESGLDLSRPVVTTCGSGVSAAVLSLGLHLLGPAANALSDGSWTEWGGRADTPVTS